MSGISLMVKLFYCTPGMDSHTWISDRSPRQISSSQPPPFTEPIPRCRGPAARGCGQASCSAYRFRAVTASTRWTRGTRRASPGHRLTATPRAIRASPSTPRSPTAPPRSRAACSAPKPAGLPPPRPPATPPAASPGPCTALPAAWPPAPELPSLGFPLSFDI
ncbi:nascent polypeptide-associated complex subunit alpha, muscle-specific form-like isoform X4 [Catharus ustulatus]|uniref:nascent polypeptide-associated complex subunit alpha, muscle-specific form-like isoform X4 n=1 Tax=Catharus ustulatus TaxID=91951 RepID=UPI00140D8CB6|nr:nascent polypeptide-associated complex subunit alpha, muscle-specific form-like isoform X4 [Catharus ustulatus]